jgi:hypothetical protein
LLLVTALTERGLWAAIRDWLDETGYYDFFAAAQDIREAPPQFAAILAESAAD